MSFIPYIFISGFYCREKAYTSAPPDGLTGGLCPAGGYCPAGSATPLPCEVGYYSNYAGAKTQYDCIPCDPGYFCAGSSSVNATQECSPGYYCTGGAGVPTQHETEAGYYTESGAFKMEPCPPGTYQPARLSETCLDCPQGFYCNGTATTSPIICPKGHYCPKKSEWPTPCPAGTSQIDEGEYELAHCDSCTVGMACESDGLELPNINCDPGHYCLNGSSTRVPIGEAFGDLCPPGYYCPEATSAYEHFPCPNGTYSNYSGNSHSDNCTLCDGGLVCSGGGLTEPNGVCAAGWYCIQGAYTDKPADGGATGDVCPIGYYCPEGTGRDEFAFDNGG